MHQNSGRANAFTLVELLIVISILIILMGLLFPAFRGAPDQARKVQAKNDLMQIVTAINAFYTEYGRYPTSGGATADVRYGPNGTPNEALFNELRGLPGTPINTRRVVFVSLPDVKDPANPRGGIGTRTGAGQLYDPWGTPYNVAIDGNYDNEIENPYGGGANAGGAKLRAGVIAWSWGKNKRQDTNIKKGDDVISWQ